MMARGQFDVQRLALAFAHDQQADVGAGLAAHHLDGLAQGHALHRLVVNADDQVARLHAGAAGGRVVDRGHDAHEAVGHLHLDTQPAELAGGGHAHVLELLDVQVGRVRVQPGQQAADRVLDQHLVLDLFNIGRLDLAQDLGKGLQIGQRQVDGLVVTGGKNAGGQGQAQPEQGTNADEAEGAGGVLHRGLRASPMGVGALTAKTSRH